MTGILDNFPGGAVGFALFLGVWSGRGPWMEMDNWAEYAKFFAALLAIVDPIGAIPIFIGLTTNQSSAERHRIGLLAAASVGLVLGGALVIGETLLRLFGITIASFRVGGGILLLLMAISMMHARVSPAKQVQQEAEESVDRDSVAVVPLGIPLLKESRRKNLQPIHWKQS